MKKGKKSFKTPHLPTPLPKFPLHHPPTQAHTYTHSLAYVTCFPRRHRDQGQVHLSLFPFRISPQSAVGCSSCVNTSPEPFWAHVGRQICPAELWHLPTCILDRTAGRHLSHTGDAGITPGLHFLPTPRSWLQPNSLVNRVQVKLAEAHVPGNWDRGVSHPVLLREQHQSLIGLEETETCQSKLLMSKGREQCLGVNKPPLSHGLVPGYLLYREPRHLSLLSMFFVQSTVLRPARHTNKHKLWTVPEALTTILKKK